MQPVAIMVPVPNSEVGFAWYQIAFPEAKVVLLPEFDFRALQIGDFLVEVVACDEKLNCAMAGTVLYWSVDNLRVALEHFQSLGSRIHRGPMPIEDGLGMCQVTDTFGNLIGLRGLYDQSSEHNY